MPEIKPDLSDENRCISVHWSLPVQCVLPSSHRENWHEAWHPTTGNRIRYRRSMGIYRTEELNGGWTVLEIPPPGEICAETQVTGWVGGQAEYWKRRARAAEAVIARVEALCADGQDVAAHDVLAALGGDRG